MMAGRTRVLFLAAAATVGCGGPSSPAPGGLAYRTPNPNPAAYTLGDTATLTMEAAVGPIEVVTAWDASAELDFRRWRRDGRVVVRFPRLSGSFRNPTQAPAVVDESAIGGPFTVRLTAAGRVTVVDTPRLDDALLNIVGPDALVRPLFVHLPAGPVVGGATWVDTVTTTEEVSGTRTVTHSVVVSTLEGDTVVDGRRLLRIRTEAENSLRVTGVTGGVEVEQELTGSTTGTVLWDERSHLLVERRAVGSLEGTLTLPGVDVAPLHVRVATRRAVRLRE